MPAVHSKAVVADDILGVANANLVHDLPKTCIMTRGSSKDGIPDSFELDTCPLIPRQIVELALCKLLQLGDIELIRNSVDQNIV